MMSLSGALSTALIKWLLVSTLPFTVTSKSGFVFVTQSVNFDVLSNVVDGNFRRKEE
jgi:hypothetical protein